MKTRRAERCIRAASYGMSPICGIPLVLLPRREQRRFIDAIEAVAPGRGFLHYNYCATSPLPMRPQGLLGKREEWTPLNFPPASVWRYTPAAAGRGAY